jgi:O-antigen ligase
VRALVSCGLLTLAVGYATATHGGIEQADWSIALGLLGLAALVYPFSKLRTDAAPLTARVTLAAPIVLLAFIAFQLVPLPAAILRLLSSTRAEIAAALEPITGASNAPLTVLPAATWGLLFQAVACVLVFVIVQRLAGQADSAGMSWAPAVPLIGIGSLEAMLGLLWRANEVDPISGTYFNKNHFAGLLELTLPLATMYALASLFRRSGRGTLRTPLVMAGSGLLAVALLMFVAIGLSLSKAGFVSALGSLVVMALYAIASRVTGSKRWVFAFALVAAGVLVFVFFQPDALVRQYGAMVADDTGEGRVPMARDTIGLIAAFPLFGSGFGTYYPTLLRYQTSALDFAVTNAHNDYLQLFAELGLVGAIILVSLLIASLANAWRVASSPRSQDARFLALACLGSLTALLLHSAADFNLYVPANTMAFAWVAGIAAGLPRAVPRHMGRQTSHSAPPGREIVHSTPPNESVTRMLIPGLGCVAILYAALSLTFFYRYQTNARAERLFCRVGVCDSFSALAVIQKEHGDDVAAVPLSDWVEFLSRDPANPMRWEDLGDALQREERTAEAKRSYDRALALGPNIPPVLVRATRLLFERGDHHAALTLMKRALDGNPSFDEIVLTDCERLGIPVSDIVAHGLPDSPAVWRSYLERQLRADFEVAPERASDAAVVWDAIVQRHYADANVTNQYVEFLLRSRGPEAAVETWAHFKQHDFAKDRIFNGDFESDPMGVRFDWRLDSVGGVAVNFDEAVAYQGRRSLRLRFDGSSNVGEVGVQQQVYLLPGSYRLRAYVRTSDITTDQGIFIRAVNVEGPGTVEGVTTSLRGSNDWTLLETVFEVPLRGRLIRVGPARKRSLKFDNLVRGIAWVDHMSIVPETPAPR